jgi:GDP-L-fucose synthase
VPILTLNNYSQILTPSSKELDLCSFQSTKSYFKKYNPQAVIHLASIVYGLQGNLSNQFSSLNLNTIINDNVMNAVNLFDVEYLFFSGTVASYPFPFPRLPLTEVDFFNGPPHEGEYGYATAKKHAYSYLKILADEKDLRFNYGIFTNLYGENDRFNLESGHVIPSIIHKAYLASLSQKTLKIWGNGEAERDFLHFNEAAKVIQMALEGHINESLFNVSSGRTSKIREIAEIIKSAAKLDSILYEKDKPVGIPSRSVSNDRIALQGFKSTVSLDKGLRDLFEWFVINYPNIRT